MYGRNRIVDYLVYRLVMRNPRVRGVLQKLIYPSGTREVNLLGQAVEIDCQSEVGYYRAAIANGSNVFFRDELPQLMTFVSLLARGTTFVDAGANVGAWSVQIASLGEIVGGLKVLAFEPHPRTFQRLQRNCRRFTNASVHNVALSDTARVLEFYETTTSGVFSVQASPFNKAASNPITIQAQPLDSYLQGIDNIAIKIDVEGHELEVLRGANDAISRGAVKVVFADGVEEGSFAEFCRILRSNGFSIYDARRRSSQYETDGHHPVIAVRRDLQSP
jgi:FkbM family methyltransferase